MSDNPLADWLRARQDAEPGPEDVEHVDAPRRGAQDGVARAGVPQGTPPGAARDRVGHGPPASWPDWGGLAGGPADDAEPATWERPPDEEAGAPARRRRLLLAAALPWAVAGGLGVAALTGGPMSTEGQQDRSTEADPHASPEAGHGSAEAGDQESAGDGRSNEVRPSTALPTARGSSVVEPALGAAAALAVRLSLTTAEAGSDADGPRRYVDLAVPDGVHQAGDVAVVTVAAVVLEGSGEQWHTSRPARFAVPLQVVDGQAVAVGDPWPLAPPAADAEGPRWEPADVDGEAVARALAAAGYTEVDGLEVDARPASETDRPLLLRARTRARAPGEPAPRDHQVWLRGEPEPAVLGAER